MGMFDYRGYSNEKVTDLMGMATALCAASSARDTVEVNDKDRSYKITGGITPANYRVVDAANVEGANSSSIGNIRLDHPIPLLTNVDGGLDARLFEKLDEDGNVIGLAVDFVGTTYKTYLDTFADWTSMFFFESDLFRQSLDKFSNIIKNYAESLGISGANVTFSGFSLGGHITNLMADNIDTLAGGFFKDSDLIALATSYVSKNSDRVLNYALENDMGARVMGNETNLWEAVLGKGYVINTVDHEIDGMTDNIVMYIDSYADGTFDDGFYSVFNQSSWEPHISQVEFNTAEIIIDSDFYDLTWEDTNIILANLGEEYRKTQWIEDKDTRVVTTNDRPMLFIGSDFGEKFQDAKGQDYFDMNAGNDEVKLSYGYDVVHGGDGDDTVNLQGSVGDWDVYKLSEGRIAVYNEKYGLKILDNVEALNFGVDDGIWWNESSFTIERNRLEGGRDDVSFDEATIGTSGNDNLSGEVVFGQGGDDIIRASNIGALIDGGAGNDLIRGGNGDDVIYGAEGSDLIYASSGQDRLEGGYGTDYFVFTDDLAGQTTISSLDFNAHDGQPDYIMMVGIFDDYQDMMASVSKVGNWLFDWTGDSVKIEYGDMTIYLDGINYNELSEDMFIFA